MPFASELVGLFRRQKRAGPSDEINYYIVLGPTFASSTMVLEGGYAHISRRAKNRRRQDGDLGDVVLRHGPKGHQPGHHHVIVTTAPPGDAEEGTLAGKVALVTGGSRGLSRAMVLASAKNYGADVNRASRKINCEAVAREVEALGRRAFH